MMAPGREETAVTVVIRDVTGTSTWVATEDGQKVYETVRAALLDDAMVNLSFEGREQVITAFLNVAIGQLLNGEFEADDLRQRLRFINVDQTDLAKISLVMTNALKYFERRNVNLANDSTPSP